MTDRIQEFVDYIEGTGAAANTVQSYARDLKLMMNKMQENGINELAEIGSAELMQYIDGMAEEGKSAATISRSIASIRRFFAYTRSKGYTFSDPTEMLRGPKVIRKLPSILTDKQIKKLIAAPDVSRVKGIRDKAMIELVSAAGVNVSEIIEMKCDDVDLDAQTITIGVRRRQISLGKRNTATLRNYYKVRNKLLNGQPDDGAFFLSCSGAKMTRQGFWKIMHVYGNSIGIENMTPQMIRHSFAVSSLRRGKDIKAVQSSLGHISSTSSNEYKMLAADPTK